MSRRELGATRIAALVLTVAAACMGCGSSEPEPATSGTAAGARKPGQPPGRADMVAAVSASKTPGAINMQFALEGRPVVGQPVNIQIMLTPTIELERLVVRFQAADGLDLTKGSEIEQFDRPAIGTGLPHTVTVVPRSDGIFYVTAVVVSDSPTESVSRNYSIPIIAGAGLAELPETSAPAPRQTGSRP